MLDDAVQMQGRQTKRKLKKILILTWLALMLLAIAWAVMHPQALFGSWQELLARISPQKSGQWIQTDYAPETCSFLLGNQVFFAEAGSLAALCLDGTAADRQKTGLESPQAVISQQAAALFEPGESELLLINKEEIHTLEIPLGVDAAAVSDSGDLAVITAGSGFQTITQWYDAKGQLLRELRLVNEAMVLAAFLHGGDTLAACIITSEGEWLLRFYSGDESTDISLGVAEVYDLRPCGEGVAVWSCNGLDLYSRQGEPTANCSFSPEQLLLWDSDSFAAAVIMDNGSTKIVTLAQDGKQESSEPLPRPPRDLSVCASRLCVLDREALLFYDKQCVQTDFTSQGALTVAVQAIPGGAMLFGDGEFMRYLET